VDVGAWEAAGRAAIDPVAWAYVAGGVGDERTVADNVAAWGRMRLRPHMLRDVSTVATATTVLGTAVPSPILVAPTAMHLLVHSEAERATARGAAAAGAVYVLSQAASTALEDVAAAAPDGNRWMQLYVQRDRGRTRAICERAAAAGYSALVVTVDSPVITSRRGVVRPLVGGPDAQIARTGALPVVPLPNLDPGVDEPDLFALVEGYESALRFEDLAVLREWAGGLPLLVKGVVRGDDAARCMNAGANGIVVSNHGGRQLDTCIATADALAEVVEAVGHASGGQGEVYVDGGIRRGVDVLKALALGARAVLVGRPVVWGLGAAGADGVTDVLLGLRDELATAMGLSGIVDVREVPTDLLA
jgi:4-hydroxymandelate oxidase